jgi:hypothetical protein
MGEEFLMEKKNARQATKIEAVDRDCVRCRNRRVRRGIGRGRADGAG